MSLSKYHTFIEVAKNESLSKAAYSTHQTVPGVSYAITSLEEEWGMPLLVRRHNKISLTPEARKLVPYIEDILNSQDKLEQMISTIKGVETGTVRVGGLRWALKQCLPPIMKNLQKDYPNIQIKIDLTIYEDLKKSLLDGCLDIAFGEESNTKMLNFHYLLGDPYVVIMNTDHPLSHRLELSLEDLKGEQLIVPEWNYDKVQKELIDKLDMAPMIGYYISDVGMMQSMAANNMGLAILPKLLMEKNWDIAAVPFKDWPEKHFGIITSDITEASPATKKFIEYVKKYFKEGNI